MKFLFLCSLLFFSSVSAIAEDPNKVIYGSDDRVEVIHSEDNLMIEKSRSVAGMFKYSSLSLFSMDGFKIKGKTLEKRGWCSSERFSNQITAPLCTGFLVADDILVTAGHCVSNKIDCLRYLWVFDYKISNDSDSKVVVPRSSVYRCKSILRTVNDPETSEDYAVIQLSRKVSDRLPLEIRESGKIPDAAPLVLIGHPKGLPMKIAGGAKVLGNAHPNFFITDTDSYGGNSGSPVFNAKTGLVEGILVRGERDYVTTPEGCNISKVCSSEECLGEDVTRITNLSSIIRSRFSILDGESEAGDHKLQMRLIR